MLWEGCVRACEKDTWQGAMAASRNGEQSPRREPARGGGSQPCNSKKLNSANKDVNFEEDPAPKRNTRLTPGLQPCGTLSKGHRLVSQTLTHRNCELINVPCVKSLRLWSCITQQWKTNTIVLVAWKTAILSIMLNYMGNLGIEIKELQRHSPPGLK